MDFDTYVRQSKTLYSRRNSATATTKISRQAGFTLIELIIAVAIVGIFASIAVPNFSKLIRRQNVNSAANEVYDLLQYARGEAVTQSRSIIISAGSTAWNGSISVKTLGNNATTLRQVDSGGVAQSVTITSAVTNLTFSPTGYSSAAACFTVTSTSDATIAAQYVGVQASGRITPPSKVVPTSGECN